MEIETGQTYTIKKPSNYFKEKYGTATPEYTVEDDHRKVMGYWWLDGSINKNIACMLYHARREVEDLPKDFPHDQPAQVFYGKIEGLGELVHRSELE